MEHILEFITKLCILGLYTCLPCCLVYQWENQHTPCNTCRITTNHIDKCFPWNYIHFDSFDHLLCNYHHLFFTICSITTLCHVSMAGTHHWPCYNISAWLTGSTICCQTRHNYTRINPTNLWIMPLQKIDAQNGIILQTFKHIQARVHYHLMVSTLHQKGQIQLNNITT